MGIQVNFFVLKKRQNSTKRPTEVYATADCVFKQPTSILAPILQLDGSVFGGANYAQIPAYGNRYYFVQDIVWLSNNIVEVHLACDLLASWKDEILDTTAFVAYDETGNKEIPDTRLSQKTTASISVNKAQFRSDYSEVGTTVVAVTGVDSTKVFQLTSSSAAGNLIVDPGDGLYTTYMNTICDAFAKIKENITGTFDDETAQSMCVQAVAAASIHGNSADNIKALYKIPFSFVAGGSGGYIYNGNCKTGAFGVEVPVGQKITKSVSVGIPWQFSDWRNNGRYTSVGLFIPGIGNMSVPAELVTGKSSIDVESTLSPATGDVAVIAKCGGQVIVSGSFNTAQNIFGAVSSGSSALSAAQSVVNHSTDSWQLATACVSAAAQTASGAMNGALVGGTTGAVAGGIMGAAQGLSGVANTALNIEQSKGNSALSIMSSAQCTQSVGSLTGPSALAVEPNVICYTVCHGTTVEPSSVSAVMGTPAMASKVLGTLTGYVQTQGAHVTIAGYNDECNGLTAIMDSGFFIE